MRLIRRFIAWLRPAADPEARAAAEQARFEEETNKTAAFDAPPAARGFKWRP